MADGDEQAPQWPADLAPGSVTEVAPGVLRVVAPNPGMMTGPGTNTYVIGGDRLAVVDPGPEVGLGADEKDAGPDQHLELLCQLFGDRIGWILVSHTHVDHSPLSRRLAAMTGARTVAFGAAPSARPDHLSGEAGATGIDPHDRDFTPDVVLADGERLAVGDLAVEAVHTPGHASNHLCFELAGSGLLFSGDHVMGGSTVVIAPPDGDMAVYLESLEKVRQRCPARIAPGHGPVIEDPGAVLDEYMHHRLSREAQVLACLAGAGPAGTTVEAIVAALYRDVPEKLHPVARYSVWAHLRKLGQERRAVTPEPDDLAAPWSLPKTEHGG